MRLPIVGHLLNGKGSAVGVFDGEYEGLLGFTSGRCRRVGNGFGEQGISHEFSVLYLSRDSQCVTRRLGREVRLAFFGDGRLHGGASDGDFLVMNGKVYEHHHLCTLLLPIMK